VLGVVQVDERVPIDERDAVVGHQVRGKRWGCPDHHVVGAGDHLLRLVFEAEGDLFRLGHDGGDHAGVTYGLVRHGGGFLSGGKV
jgi:hypothetical protein